MNQVITAKEFVQLWTEFIKTITHSKEKWETWYNEDEKTWTERTIGKPVSDDDSPFGKYLIERRELRFRKEDGLFDLAFAPENNFRDIESLHEHDADRKEMLQKAFYPMEYSILLEHENSIYHCCEEMAKLAYVRARLKVLVTYNENVDAKSDYAYANDIVLKNFEKIIGQSNQNFPENPKTQYLLLIGQYRNQLVDWKAWAFNIFGNITPLV